MSVYIFIYEILNNKKKLSTVEGRNDGEYGRQNSVCVYEREQEKRASSNEDMQNISNFSINQQ